MSSRFKESLYLSFTLQSFFYFSSTGCAIVYGALAHCPLDAGDRLVHHLAFRFFLRAIQLQGERRPVLPFEKSLPLL